MKDVFVLHFLLSVAPVHIRQAIVLSVLGIPEITISSAFFQFPHISTSFNALWDLSVWKYNTSATLGHVEKHFRYFSFHFVTYKVEKYYSTQFVITNDHSNYYSVNYLKEWQCPLNFRRCKSYFLNQKNKSTYNANTGFCLLFLTILFLDVPIVTW